MVQPADGNGELVADFPPHRPLLGKLEVVGIRRRTAADNAGLRGHELQVFAVALTHWFADNGDRLFAGVSQQWRVAATIRLLIFQCGRLKFSDLAQLGGEGGLDR